MDRDQIAALRSFNRVVTERVGALRDEYLARARPLGTSRVLWEVPSGGTDARELRARLGLDSGYLSRILGSLESEGLVELSAAEDDARVRSIRLTAEGVAEKTTLDRLSDDLARSILEPLNEAQRDRLVAAASTVELLLTAGLVEIRIEDPRSEAARYCIGEYFRELDDRFDTGFDPTKSISADAVELSEPNGILLIAWLRGHPIGCGALKLHGDEPAEAKRMWVLPASRRLGLGRRILAAIEAEASARGVSVLRLETNHALEEAIGLYRSAGYQEVEAFNDEPFAHHWFEKRLA